MSSKEGSEPEPQSIKLVDLFNPGLISQIQRFFEIRGWDSNSASDHTQEVMMRAWKKRAEFDRTRPLLRWLYQFARNIHREESRRGNREKLVLDSDLMEKIAHFEERLASVEDRSLKLRRCLTQLNPLQLEAIQAKFGNLSQRNQRKSIGFSSVLVYAQKRGFKVEQVYHRIRRAKAILLKCMRSKVFQD